MNQQKVQKNDYLERVKLFTNLHDEKTASYITLIFTFASFIFFGLFAINPTLGTIASLKRELEDAQSIDQQLETKINNLSTLQQLYSSMKPDIPILLSAIPQTAEAPRFLAQTQSLANNAGVTVKTLDVGEAPIKGDLQVSDNPISYPFEIGGTGNEEQIRNFYASLSQMIRITTFDTISASYNEDTKNYTFTIKGKVYFKP